MGPPVSHDMGVPESSPETSDTETMSSDVFEGPEKKLEVYFGHGRTAAGFRQFQSDAWSDVLVDAAVTILHQESNAEFDSYLLSESSLFVFPERVILKTCGTTTLLLVLPKLLTMSEQIGCDLEHVLYSHLRYKFPEQQLYPHSSFQQEKEYLSRTLGNAHASVLGPPDGRCWYVLHASGSQQAPPQLALSERPVTPNDGDDIFEMAMEGLSEKVCAQFFKLSYAGSDEGELAGRMTAQSGIDDLMPGVKVDDWAFDPCGYSMNGLRGGFYYTIHITPESGFSFASFETNDPKYREPAWVERIVATFAPSVLTLTLTTRRVICELDAYTLGGFERTGLETTQLGEAKGLSVCAINFQKTQADLPLKVDAEDGTCDSDLWWEA